MTKFKAIRIELENLGVLKGQQEFAQKLGLTQSQISKLERGQREASKQTLLLLQALYGINLEWFDDDEKKMFNTINNNILDKKQLNQAQKIYFQGIELANKAKTFLDEVKKYNNKETSKND